LYALVKFKVAVLSSGQFSPQECTNDLIRTYLKAKDVFNHLRIFKFGVLKI